MYITMAKMFRVYQQCLDMNNEEYVKWSEKAREYGLGVTKDDGEICLRVGARM